MNDASDVFCGVVRKAFAEASAVIDTCAMLMLMAERTNGRIDLKPSDIPTPRCYLKRRGHDVPDTLSPVQMLELASRVTADAAKQVREAYERAMEDGQ